MRGIEAQMAAEQEDIDATEMRIQRCASWGVLVCVHLRGRPRTKCRLMMPGWPTDCWMHLPKFFGVVVGSLVFEPWRTQARGGCSAGVALPLVCRTACWMLWLTSDSPCTQGDVLSLHASIQDVCIRACSSNVNVGKRIGYVKAL